MNLRTQGTLTLLLLLTCPLDAQDPKPETRPVPIATAYRELNEALSKAAKGADPTTKRVELLRAFLERYSKTPTATQVLTARCRLGTLLLTSFEPANARQQFDAVLTDAPETARDLRGRAMYGTAQALELEGDVQAARKQHDRTRIELRGSRYARFAEIAARRLRAARRIVVGSPAPNFGPRIDLTGKPRQRSDLDGAPSLVVFCSLEDDERFEEVRALVAAAKEGGITVERTVVFAMHGDRTKASETVTREQWSGPVLLCADEFLDEDVLRYQVRELPSTFLLGADGTLLARDITPRRLREVLERLR